MVNLKKSAKGAAKAVSKASKTGAAKVATKAQAAKKKLGPAPKVAKQISNKSKANSVRAAKKSQQSFSKVKSAAAKLGKKISAPAKSAGSTIAKVAKKARKEFSKLAKKAKVLCPKPKKQIVNKRTPKNPRAGKKKPGNAKKRAAAAKAIWPGQQNYNNCGVMSSAQIIGQATGTVPNEDTITRRAINQGWASSPNVLGPNDPIPFEAGGTSSTGRQSIMNDAGVPSTIAPYSREALAQALWDRKGVVANLHTDGASWWKNSDGTSRGSGFHAIIITDGVYDKKGRLTSIIINDTGVGMQGKVVSIEDFEKSVAARGNNPAQLNITNNPIWP